MLNKLTGQRRSPVRKDAHASFLGSLHCDYLLQLLLLSIRQLLLAAWLLLDGQGTYAGLLVGCNMGRYRPGWSVEDLRDLTTRMPFQKEKDNIITILLFRVPFLL